MAVFFWRMWPIESYLLRNNLSVYHQDLCCFKGRRPATNTCPWRQPNSSNTESYPSKTRFRKPSCGNNSKTQARRLTQSLNLFLLATNPPIVNQQCVVYFSALIIYANLRLLFLTVYPNHFELENGVITTPKRRSILPALTFICFCTTKPLLISLLTL